MSLEDPLSQPRCGCRLCGTGSRPPAQFCLLPGDDDDPGSYSCSHYNVVSRPRTWSRMMSQPVTLKSTNLGYRKEAVWWAFTDTCLENHTESNAYCQHLSMT
eukprot:scaffold99223_cov12-Prasinocladus_malaysianus.AAC.1